MSTIRDTAQPVSALICPRELPGDGEVHGDTSASHDVTNTLQADRHGGEWSSHDSNESAGPDGPPAPPNVQDPASCGVRRALFECAGGPAAHSSTEGGSMARSLTRSPSHDPGDALSP